MKHVQETGEGEGESEREGQALARQFLTRRPVNVQPYALGFHALQSGAPRRTFEASPQIPFAISGLLIWGATADTLITGCQVRRSLQLMASEAPIPALLFASELPFADLCARLREDDGRLAPFRTRLGRLHVPGDVFEGWLSEYPRVAEHQLFRLPVLAPGDRVQLELEGPFHQMVFWGQGVCE